MMMETSSAHLFSRPGRKLADELRGNPVSFRGGHGFIVSSVDFQKRILKLLAYRCIDYYRLIQIIVECKYKTV